METIIFKNFYSGEEPRKILPFIFLSSAFHSLIVLLVLSGVFTQLQPYSPPIANHNNSEEFLEGEKPVANRSEINQSLASHSDRFNQKAAHDREISYRPLQTIKPRRCRVSGFILDKQKEVVPGAAVAVVNLSSNQSIATLTDMRGKYSLQGIPPGEYEIRVRSVRFNNVIRKRIKVKSGSELIYNHFPKDVTSTLPSAEVKTARQKAIDLRSIPSDQSADKTRVINKGERFKPDSLSLSQNIPIETFQEMIKGKSFSKMSFFKDGRNWIIKLFYDRSHAYYSNSNAAAPRLAQHFILTNQTVVFLNSLYYIYIIFQKIIFK